MADENILLTFKCPECGARVQVVAQSRKASEETSKGSMDEARLKKELGDAYSAELYVHEVGGDLHIASIHFLGKERWWKINQALLKLGAEWVSAGKESHWRVKRRS